MAATCDGNGAIISFALTGAVGRTISIAGYREYVEVIDDTDLADTEEQAKPGKLKRRDAFEVQFFVDPEAIPRPGVSDTCTLTYPPGENQTNGPTETGKAFITEVTRPPLRQGENLIGTYQVKWMEKPVKANGS